MDDLDAQNDCIEANELLARISRRLSILYKHQGYGNYYCRSCGAFGIENPRSPRIESREHSTNCIVFQIEQYVIKTNEHQD